MKRAGMGGACDQRRRDFYTKPGYVILNRWFLFSFVVAKPPGYSFGGPFLPELGLDFSDSRES